MKITRENINGLPAGTEYVYGCKPCAREFVINSFWRHCAAGLASLVMLAIGAAFYWGATAPGWRYGGAGVSVALFLGLAIDNISKGLNRRKYPIVAVQLLESRPHL